MENMTFPSIAKNQENVTFCQIKQHYTKNNTLFNTKAYLGCLQGTLTFEFHIYCKSMAQSSLLTHLFPIIVPLMLKAALKNSRNSVLYYVERFYENIVFHAFQFSLKIIFSFSHVFIF